MNILIFGLGTHGGALADTIYFASSGHQVRVTDLQSADVLEGSLAALSAYQIPCTLGRHTEEDVRWADLVVKNPGVPDDLPVLEHARYITNDIGYFFDHSPSRIIGITGTKGKSTTAAILHQILQLLLEDVHLGGNIGTSPLSFIESTTGTSTTVLELSSWQIHDLARNSFRPCEQVIFTNIYPDHQDRYRSMGPYIEDKMSLLGSTAPPGQIIIPEDFPYLPEPVIGSAQVEIWRYAHKTAKKTYPHQIISDGRRIHRIEGGRTLEAVDHALDQDLLPAVCAAAARGYPLEEILRVLPECRRPAHRRETICVHEGVRFIDDSTATIPEAASYTIGSLQGPIHLIAGGATRDWIRRAFSKHSGAAVPSISLEGLSPISSSLSSKTAASPTSDHSHPWDRR